MNYHEQIEPTRSHLKSCKRPLFLFDDDPDGLASFLLLYRFVGAGKGIPLKGSQLDERMLAKVEDYLPDVVIILDKAEVSQDFFSGLNVPCIWIDHHEPQQRQGVLYINPRVEDSNVNKPTSQLCYEIVQQDAWLAIVGIYADWCVPPSELLVQVQENYPKLLPRKTQDAAYVLFESDIGVLANMFSFNLKGKTSQVLSSMKILTRISHPQELLEYQHSQARLVMKKYEKKKQEYDQLLSQVMVEGSNPLLVFTYTDAVNSYTTDLSNELLYKYPSKTILVARLSGDSYKCSLRASQYNLREMILPLLENVQGTGGGHEHACGAIIPQDQFSTFSHLLQERLSEMTLVKERKV